MLEEVLSNGVSLPDVHRSRLAWGLPPLPTNLMLRRRLFPKLDSVINGGVALVSGPPGCGKSALVSEWAKHSDPGDLIWLSLSPDDDIDPDLWTRARHEFAELAGGVGGAEGVVRTHHPVILVIDNIDVITQPEHSAGLADLVNSMAEQVGLILIGRHTAHLPLHRVGLQSSIIELGQDELACTLDETSDFLSAWLSQPVPDDWVRLVARRTEGWACGIRLASLTISDLGAPADVSECLRTDRGLIADYFEKEVFDQQSPEVRNFLWHTSILDVLEPEVCDAVSGRQDSLQLLEALARQNMFVRQLPGTERFRYHGLFRGFLRHQLALAGTDAEHEARLKASRCLEQQGDTKAAVDQMRAAGAYDELFSLALGSTLRALEGRTVDPEVMLPAGIPDSYFERSPLRMYPLCVSYLAQLELDRAAGWLRRMELAGEAEVDGGPALRARSEMLWALYDLAQMNAEGLMHHLQSSRALTDSEAAAAFHRSLRGGHQWVRELDTALSSLAPMMEAKAEIWRGRPARASQLLSDAYGVDRAVTDPVLAALFGEVLSAEGQIRQAEELAKAALTQAAAAGRPDSTATVGVRIVLARVLYEQDDLNGADEQLARADRICRTAGQDQWRTEIDCELARLDLARGRTSEALRRLDGLTRTELLSMNVPLRQAAHETAVRCRLALGDLLGAEDLLIDSAAVSPSPELLARFHLATGRPDRASAEIGRSGFTARGRPSIERLLLQTRVYLQAGNRRAAEHALQRAVNLARADGFVRVFLDEPKQIIDLLAAVSAAGADGFVQKLLDRAPAQRPQAGAAQPYILEPLTDRERELLGYLPCHLSQSEIASRMFISANTVKTHMKGLYRKLGASSRSEAVDIARDCGLLSPTIGV